MTVDVTWRLAQPIILKGEGGPARFLFLTTKREFAGVYSQTSDGTFLNAAGDTYRVLHQYDRHAYMTDALTAVVARLGAAAPRSQTVSTPFVVLFLGREGVFHRYGQTYSVLCLGKASSSTVTSPRGSGQGKLGVPPRSPDEPPQVVLQAAGRTRD